MQFNLRFMQRLHPEKGSVFILVAVAAMMLIAATGTAVDMARAQILQAKIQMALDAAGLAAGATANTIDVQTQAQKYFNANFPTGYLGSGAVTVNANISTDQTTVTLSANTTQATTFMQAIGINSVSVAASSTITRANEGMELVLVLDNTGSMNTILPGDSITKIQALKNSINDTNALLDTLYGVGNDTATNLWVGVVPFTDMVNIGNPPPSASGKNWMDTTFDGALDYGPTVPTSGACPTYGSITGVHHGSGSSSRCIYSPLASEPTSLSNWAGCVLARVSPYEASDQLPDAATPGTLFQAYDYASDATGVSSNRCTGGSNPWMCSAAVSGGREYVYTVTSGTTGPNLNCVATPILPMVASKQKVENEVTAMAAGGSTMINLGMGWGYRMLSENWQGWWGGGDMENTGSTTFPKLPLNYGTPLMNKVVILMTDGMNSAPGSATGSAYQSQSLPTNSDLDTYTETICDSMKSHHIIIYAIGFGTTDNPAYSYESTYVDGTLLKYCATDSSHYFLATSSTALSGVFQRIGSALANLRVSQ